MNYADLLVNKLTGPGCSLYRGAIKNRMAQKSDIPFFKNNLAGPAKPVKEDILSSDLELVGSGRRLGTGQAASSPWRQSTLRNRAFARAKPESFAARNLRAFKNRLVNPHKPDRLGEQADKEGLPLHINGLLIASLWRRRVAEFEAQGLDSKAAWLAAEKAYPITYATYLADH